MSTSVSLPGLSTAAPSPSGRTTAGSETDSGQGFEGTLKAAAGARTGSSEQTKTGSPSSAQARGDSAPASQNPAQGDAPDAKQFDALSHKADNLRAPLGEQAPATEQPIVAAFDKAPKELSSAASNQEQWMTRLTAARSLTSRMASEPLTASEANAALKESLSGATASTVALTKTGSDKTLPSLGGKHPGDEPAGDTFEDEPAASGLIAAFNPAQALPSQTSKPGSESAQFGNNGKGMSKTAQLQAQQQSAFSDKTLDDVASRVTQRDGHKGDNAPFSLKAMALGGGDATTGGAGNTVTSASIPSAQPAVVPGQAQPGQPAPTSTGLYTGVMNAQVGSDNWNGALGQHMIRMSAQGQGQAELHLNPRDMGPLSISLKMDDQGAQAHFFSANAHVRSALETALPHLKEAMADSGIQLGQTSVSDQQQPQHFAFGQSNQDSGTKEGRGETSAFGQDRDDARSITGTADDILARAPTSSRLGGIDLFA
ncbi:flagellar hook-length control protein FliK [Larsenimonas suaedae]|uniref:Flagellar hook-length control protein FliK n=1 Tax=Larsenimonas suaedae TaxID=1851019 RepID=A0ABU1GUB1_9GAMM|nr:flagellar hook-length control protein FliK [Larsenimonas suaedae]MCM2971609.1 flagellar hook-length control protein FliK [Larsenimonas suaedae]MDR5895161.1 flagellar hook-length control protein FliK [Larsenimonas suaedae]